MRQFIIKILKSLINIFDKKNKDIYNENHNDNGDYHTIHSMLEGINNSNSIVFDLEDFYEAHGRQATKEIFLILNDYYISVLSTEIHKGNTEEIGKLKYLQIAIMNIKTLLDNNKDNE